MGDQLRSPGSDFNNCLGSTWQDLIRTKYDFFDILIPVFGKLIVWLQQIHLYILHNNLSPILWNLFQCEYSLLRIHRSINFEFTSIYWRLRQKIARDCVLWSDKWREMWKQTSTCLVIRILQKGKFFYMFVITKPCIFHSMP